MSEWKPGQPVRIDGTVADTETNQTLPRGLRGRVFGDNPSHDAGDGRGRRVLVQTERGEFVAVPEKALKRQG